MHTSSWYAATAKGLKRHPTLADHIDCDVCVIGGGYTGLSTALHLQLAGFKVVLLESRCIGWGASGRNGGQLGSGQRLEQDALEHMLGNETAQDLWAIAEESKDTVKSLINRYQIDCDYKPGILHACHKPKLAREEADYAKKLQTDYAYPSIRAVNAEEIHEMLATKAYYGGSLDTGAGHLHPLNYALGLASAFVSAGGLLFENTPALNYSNGSTIRVKTKHGRVSAKQLVLACNGYLDRLEPRIESKIMPINNFILATEPLDSALAKEIIRDDVAVADSRFVINYYRLSSDKRLLFGGGENYAKDFPKDIAAFVRRYMLKIYPQLQDTGIDYAWGGTLAITLNRMPHIGRLENDIYFSQGFSGHGVGMATMAGKLTAEAIAGTAQRYDVFSHIPMHSFPGGRWLRYPMQVLGMLFYSLRDRL